MIKGEDVSQSFQQLTQLLDQTAKGYIYAGQFDSLNNALDIANAKLLNPYCIDVSSSVEVDGYKDFEKMKEFIRGCRL